MQATKLATWCSPACQLNDGWGHVDQLQGWTLEQQHAEALCQLRRPGSVGGR